MRISKAISFEEEKALHLTREWRVELPYLGVKKLYSLIGSDITLGRDKLFTLLRKEGLLIKRKSRYAHTTNSFHHFKKHKNLIKDKVIKKPNEVYVSDITYLRLQTGFSYLSLVTDAFSRKIVGYHLSESLSVEGTLQSMKMALKEISSSHTLIHHSDRGIQYCCKEYSELLKTNCVEVSMGEAGNCYENALAERVNGILKEEFNLVETFPTFKMARKAVKEAVEKYNQKRPHWSLKLKTPDQIHYNVA